MVGIVIVSHSYKVAEGVKELAKQMAVNVPIVEAGGTFEGELGTDIEKIIRGIEQVYSEDGVIVLFDLGSAYMNAEMAIETLRDSGKSKIEILDTALVEGAIVAAVESSIGKSMENIKNALKNMRLNKMPS